MAPVKNTLPVIPSVPAMKNATSLNNDTGPAPVSNAPTKRELCMMAAVGGLRMFSYACNASAVVAYVDPTFERHDATHNASCMAWLAP